MLKELIEDLQSCIQPLYKMLEDGIIEDKINLIFDQWYLHKYLVSFILLYVIITICIFVLKVKYILINYN